MNPARLAAVRSIVSIRKNGRYANLELDATLKKANLSSRDSALFTTLVYGVIEKEITLNHFISKFCNRKTKDISPFIRATLQTALYQLHYLDNIPARAVLYETADIAKHIEKQGAANLVTAVLHAYLRAIEEKTDLFCELKGNQKLSIQYSIPVWMIELWSNAYGAKKAEEICLAFTLPSKTHLNVNLLKTTATAFAKKLNDNGYLTESHPENENLIHVSGFHGDLRNLIGYNSGDFFVQDYSSTAAVNALDPHPGETIADVCAAPGGKTFAAAIKMNNQGIIYSSDLHPNRAKLIMSGAARLGIDIINIEVRDARKSPDALINKIDRVLCDVPCSGLGVLSKKPDLRHKSAQEIEALPEIQFEILSASSLLVKDGGRLVYSTCTLNPKENEQVVERFLKLNNTFALIGCPVTIFPQNGECDGFFYAIMEKQTQ